MGERRLGLTNVKAAIGPADPGREYRFYRLVPERLKILDEGALGDAVFVSAVPTRSQGLREGLCPLEGPLAGGQGRTR